MQVGERRIDESNNRRSTMLRTAYVFILVGGEDWRLSGMSEGPVFDLQTGNLPEIESIACDDDCAIGDGDGGYS